jgi:pimeloyl-ACP methyl ester carboxylesterase
MNAVVAQCAPVRAPSRFLRLLELRAPWELAATLVAWPLLKMAPRGDGHSVLVLPGLIASDESTGLLRHFLSEHGYAVHGWGLGHNLGPREGVEQAMLDRIDKLHASSARKLSLVGWSLGGVYARLLASRRPEAVRCVVTLGAPLTGNPKATSAWRVYEWVSGQQVEASNGRLRQRPPSHVPTTSIFSRSDGIVAWQCSVDSPGPRTENIEVAASHIGLGVHPGVLYALADRLAQPEGAWQAFNPHAPIARLLGIWG